MRITENGRPKLNSLTKASKGFMRHFKDLNYECYEWLTASTSFVGRVYFLIRVTGHYRSMDFIYKIQVSALLFDEYCIMHIVMEVYVVL